MMVFRKDISAVYPSKSASGSEVIAHDLRERLTGVDQHIMHAVLFAAILDTGLEGIELALIGLLNLRRASQNLGHIFQPVELPRPLKGNSSS